MKKKERSEKNKPELNKADTGDSKKEEDLLATLQRLQAEFDNYKKRTEREQENLRERAAERILRELLPIIDNFSLALRAHEGKDDFYAGVEMIYAQLLELLNAYGVIKIEALGKKFDARFHEALMTKPSDEDENTIIEVLQDGYMLSERVLRPAKVCVSKK